MNYWAYFSWVHYTTGFGAFGCVPGEATTFLMGRTREDLFVAQKRSVPWTVLFGGKTAMDVDDGQVSKRKMVLRRLSWRNSQRSGNVHVSGVASNVLQVVVLCLLFCVLK